MSSVSDIKIADWKNDNMLKWIRKFFKGVNLMSPIQEIYQPTVYEYSIISEAKFEAGEEADNTKIKDANESSDNKQK